MHIPFNNSKEINTPEGTIWKYFLNKEVGVSYQVLKMRSPQAGQHLNKETNEIYFIIKGTAKFVLGNEEYDVNEKDVVVVEANIPHYIETNDLTYVTITRPDWQVEQYEHVD
jgi:mannose-6-phosphate isomerase-like protein (cupin superfamily)